MQGIAVIALLFAGGLLAATLAPAQSQTPGTWSQKAPMPAVRGEVAAAAVGDRLFALGGGVAESGAAQRGIRSRNRSLARACAVATAARPSRRRRARRQNPHLRRVHPSVHQGAGDVVFQYDPAADSWRTLAPMPAPRAAVGVAVLDGKIHVIGGRGLDAVTVTRHEVYDPASGKWSAAAPLPRARDHMAVVAVNGKIHVIGGRLAGPADRTGQHDVYDPATNSWASAAPLPTPRSGVAATLYKD